MARYAIGDVQGCGWALQRLLATIEFDPTSDDLWLVGDLVNRGPASIDVLRFVRDLGDRATVVLGNHDLHLLARAVGVTPAKRRDTLEQVLVASDREELLDWLISRPLMVAQGDWAMVHAGLLPQWTVPEALELAAEASAALQGPEGSDLLARYGNNEDDTWWPHLDRSARARVVLNAMTRLRVCRPGNSMDLGFKGKPGEAAAHAVPWFDVPGRRSVDRRIIFGHWSSLGLRVKQHVVGLDSGCIWGGSLSALRLDDGALFQVPCSP